MKVQEVMTRGVECIGPDTKMDEAARRMRDLDVGSLPVCGDQDKLVGIVTDRDIVVRGIAHGKDPKTTAVRDAMTPNIHYCFADQDVEEAARLMKDKQIRRLAVLDRDKRLVGIVSLGDLAVDTGDELLAGEALEAISEPKR